MSLINDALKRAQDVQHTTAPGPSAPGPQLRPAEPAQAVMRGAGLFLPAVLAVIALLLLFIVWQAVQRGSPADEQSGSSGLEVRARTTPPGVPQQTIEQQPSAVAAAPSTTPAPARPRPAPPSLQSATESPAPVLPTPVSDTNQTAAAQRSAPTNLPPARVEPPAPPPLKLQGIVLSGRPSALISGRTVFLGDHVRDYRVTKISGDTVTLAGTNGVKVLVMGE